MFSPKKVTLGDTLSKVNSFIKELEDGIEKNDTEVNTLCTELQVIEDTIKGIEAQSGQARKLLAKLQ